MCKSGAVACRSPHKNIIFTEWNCTTHREGVVLILLKDGGE